jgi:hypothetical protein
VNCSVGVRLGRNCLACAMPGEMVVDSLAALNVGFGLTGERSVAFAVGGGGGGGSLRSIMDSCLRFDMPLVVPLVERRRGSLT